MSSNASNKLASSDVCVSFHDLCYEVEQKVDNRVLCGKSGKRDILHRVSGLLPAGLNAIMGPTGSGKTSLLDVLAQRKDPKGLREGAVLFDGRSPPENIRLMSGYVVQDDIVMGTLTVRENLNFSANLRLCPKKNDAETKRRKVDRVIEQLGLQACANTLVGTDFKRGVSGGERKRVNIGMEMILDPPVLFLDEPTTGLDANTANSIVILLHRLARDGRNIIMSIHQPRYSIFTLFHRLVLLNRGEIVYSGAAAESVDHFRSIGYQCPSYHNPADFFLDVLGGDVKLASGNMAALASSARYEGRKPPRSSSCREEDDDDDVPLLINIGESPAESEEQPAGEFAGFYDDYNDSSSSNSDEDDFVNARYLVERYKKSDVAAHDEILLSKIREDFGRKCEEAFLGGGGAWRRRINANKDYATGFFTQLKEVGRRTVLNRVRNPMGSYVQLINACMFALIIGGIYFKSDHSFRSGLQNRAGVFFFLVLSQVMSNLSAIEAFIQNREFFRHESASGYYRTSVYFLSQVFADLLPNRILPNIISSVIVYTMIGLKRRFVNYLVFLLGLTLTTVSAVSIGFAVSSSCRVFLVANALVSIPYILMMLFGGFLVNLGSLLPWLSWIKYLSIFRYGINILTVNEMEGLIFIDDPTYPGFDPDSPNPCFSDVTNHTIPNCVTGEQYMDTQGIEYGEWGLWQNALSLGLISLFFLFLSYVQLRRVSKFK